MQTHFNRAVALLVTLFAILLVETRSSAQSLKWDTSWMPDDTFLSMSVNVRHLITVEKPNSELYKDFEKGLKIQAGAELSQIEQIQLLFFGKTKEGDEADVPRHYLFATKVRFSQPQNMEDIVLTMSAEEKKIAEHKGHKYYTTREDFDSAFFAPDDQTLILATEAAVLRIMDCEQSMGVIRERVRAATDTEVDAFITFQHDESFTKMLEKIMSTVEGLPFDLADIVGNAKQGSMTVSLQDGKPITGTIETKDKESAERLQGALEALVALGERGLPAARIASKEREITIPDGGDPAYYEMVRRGHEFHQVKLLDIGEKILHGVRFTTNENYLEFQVTVMEGIGDFATSYGELVRASFNYVGQFQKGRARIVKEFSSFEDVPRLNLIK